MLKVHNGSRRRSAAAPQMVVMPCKYRTGRVLGSGTYAVVREMEHVTTGERYAGKIISKRVMRGREQAIPNEISILRRLSRKHANILTLVDYFETPHNVYLITELCTGGELFEHILRRMPATFTEDDAAAVMRQIVDGVCFLHAHGVVHRDLKPENCLFKTSAPDSDVAIADFGMSRIVGAPAVPEGAGGNRALTTHCGTPGYMAPEMVLGTGHGPPVDMWAAGVIAFFVLSGYAPFERDNPRAEAHAVVACDYAFEPRDHWRHISPAAKHFIAALLASNPDKRMTATQALAHPWLQGEGRMGQPRPVSLAPATPPPMLQVVSASGSVHSAESADDAGKTLSVHSEDESAEMGSRDLIPGLARHSRAKKLHMSGLLHSLTAHLLRPPDRHGGGDGVVSERTSHMDVDGLLTPGSSATCSPATSLRASSSSGE
ncbi:Calcium/calmodulin-dependent protein kinase type I [Coemansia thaxteri]|uniref:Calcium/calmodulin-dependent protein kinase type I n=1 Tax=Coemansia thaxteri TaxID=2663907 RepID=A0A9W8BE82_9FUNG|nr:Calcium/calmodulin-dependent protein kinase type I [Coemansia thaxteri]KAJ2007543.1 Calcium/calmodulin-dependent protein kinase type I [Coemansia thaxteri]KAJ2472466.1 Calcium/calmodulin-dependent protein kinase type I [Coemansia sp. RSA 2322]KAJ2484613.1 Calcium/calmodulin-dependent protein kinase type I [Coemansia sp. RSA 2320]